MKSISLLFILLGFNAALYSQQRIYVSQNASGANTGASWADAFNDLQTALAVAEAGDEIWVAEGSYKPTDGSDRTLSFEPPSGIRLIGGFAGNESTLAQRTWENHPTELSGDIGIADDSTDNSYNVLYLFEPDSNTVVDGFFIRYGNADFSGPAEFRDRRQCGGGMYIMAGEMDAYALIINCVFEHNTARSHGGGLIENSFGEGSAGSLIQHCRFENNRSLGNGGGLAKYGNSWEERGEEITHCDFLSNFAQQNGGGLYYTDVNGNNRFDLTYCAFLGNVAGNNGGGSFIALGRPGNDGSYFYSNIYKYNTASSYLACFFAEVPFSFSGSCIFESCQIEDNYQNNSAFIIGMDFILKPQELTKVSELYFAKNSGGLLISTIGEQFFEKSILENNHSFFMNFTGKSTTFRNNTIRLNYFDNSLVSINLQKPKQAFFENSFFYNNKRIGSLTGNFAIEYSIVSDIQTIIHINNNTFIVDDQNISRFFYFVQTGPIVNDVFASINNNNFLMYHVLTRDILLSININKTIAYCSIDTTGLNPNVFNNNNLATLGPGILYGIAPLFRDTANGDYRLLPCSPLINAGDNSVVSPGATDLDGRSRIIGGRVDIGAYEHPGISYAGAPEAQGACAGAYAGRVLFSPQEGCPPYSYAWQRPSDGSSGTRLDSLLPGEYFFSITDSRGQVLIDTVLLPESIPPSVATVSAPAQCGSNGGSISVQPSGGTPPFVYNWADAPGQDTPLRFNLAPGEYRYTLSDGAGCRDSALLNIAVQGLLPLSSSGTPVSCFGGSDGTLTVAALGAAAPVQYSWEPGGASTPSLTGLTAGLYSLNVSDAWGCTTSMMFEVDEPDSLQFEGLVQDATNLAPMGGSILLDPITGGTPPYNLAWDNGSTANPLQNLAPGEYRVSVRDNKNCLSEWTFMVDLITSSGEPQAGSGLFLYPNPARSLVWIQGELTPGTLLQVFDAQGRMVKELIYQPGQGLEVGDLAAGTYQVRNAEFGVRSGSYGVRNAECGMRNAEWAFSDCALILVSHRRAQITYTDVTEFRVFCVNDLCPSVRNFTWPGAITPAGHPARVQPRCFTLFSMTTSV